MSKWSFSWTNCCCCCSGGTAARLCIQSLVRRHFSVSRWMSPLQPWSPLCLRTHLKSTLLAFYHGSSDQSWAALHRTSVLANSLLILTHRPIFTCVWFETTVSVMLRFSLRGQGGAPATFLSGREHTHKECVGWREMGSVRREMSATSLHRKGERSLVDGDEFHSLRESREVKALQSALYGGSRGLATIDSFSVGQKHEGVLEFRRQIKTKHRDVHKCFFW